MLEDGLTSIEKSTGAQLECYHMEVTKDSNNVETRTWKDGIKNTNLNLNFHIHLYNRDLIFERAAGVTDQIFVNFGRKDVFQTSGSYYHQYNLNLAPPLTNPPYIAPVIINYVTV